MNRLKLWYHDNIYETRKIELIRALLKDKIACTTLFINKETKWKSFKFVTKINKIVFDS